MNNIPELYDLVEYELYNENYDRKVIPEPVGWKDDLIQLKRSEKNFTTVTKYSTNLKFIGEGANFITQVFAEQGFEAKIILTKRRIHPVNQEVEIRYVAILDGYTYSLEKSEVKINAVESDLMAKVNGYKDESVELIRTESIDGVEIDPIIFRDATIDGKQIELVSKLDLYEEYTPYTIPHGIGNRFEYVTFHMKEIANSDDQISSVTNPRLSNGNNNLPLDGSTQNMIYAIAQEDKTLDLSIDLDFEFRRTRNTSLSQHSFVLYLLTFYDNSVNGDSQYKYLSRELLAVEDSAITTDPDGRQVKTLKYKGRQERPILKGQSWALAVFSTSYDGESIEMEYNTTKVTVVEDSLVDPTKQKVIYVYDAIEQLLRIMTGESTQILVSDYFGRQDLGYKEDGPGAYMTICSGFMARQFEDKPLSINFDNLMDSLFAILNISYSFEKSGFKEFLRVEPLGYFFNANRYVFDKKVSTKDIKFSINNLFSPSGIKLGYEKGGEDYKEAVGLDEYNGNINWLTPAAKSTTKYERISKIRADSTGLEFARRKPQLEFGTEDTDYDSDVFILDMKLIGNVLRLRTWEDDFLEPPQDVYNPSTAYNLRFSPREIFRRHEFMINAGVSVYNSGYIRFGSSIGNSDIIQDGTKANDDIAIADLDYARFKNINVEFTLDTDYYMEQAVINNIYGIFEFSSEKGQIIQFRLFEFKNNKYKGLLINGFQ